jgi:hypothetical protein
VDKKTQSVIDFQTRKSVHINLTRISHSEFRKKLLDCSLSMQEVFELFASLVGEDDNRAVSIVKEAQRNKREKTIKRLSHTEAENLFDAISEIDPFNLNRDES